MIHLFPGLPSVVGSQRWREGRDSYRPPDDARFDPRHHEVVLHVGPGSEREVNPFVVRHHYSGSVPNSGRYRYLLIDTRRPHWSEGGVVGAAVFGTSGGPHCFRASFPFLGDATATAAIELQRLVLLDEVRKNGESWFVAQCMRKHEASLARHGIEGVVSFSDPVPRWAADGSLILPGHTGCTYQALNAHYTGRAKARWSWYRIADGCQINERDLTKVRASCPCCGSGKSASGGSGAVDRFVSWGARTPKRGECRRAWLEQVLPTLATRRRHGGNHRYLWGLSRPAKRALVRLHGAPDPARYPKTIDPVERPVWAAGAA